MSHRSARPGGCALNPNTQRPQCMVFGCEILNNCNCCFFCDHKGSCPDPCLNHPDRCQKCIYPTKWKDKIIKVFVSQPMRGKSKEEIDQNILLARRFAEDTTHKRVHIMETYAPAYANAHPIAGLAHALEMLAKADLCVLMPGWDSARGCIIEHETAVTYGVPVAYYEEKGACK